jgi:proline iminopeptidase
MPTAELNGTSIFYTVVGDGPPCLVMHGGLGLDHHYMHPFLDDLGDVLQLVYYDVRGNGSSGRPDPATITHAQLVEDAVALADHLGAERVSVLGHSYGGFIALELALAHPERVGNLILVDTGPTGPDPQVTLANARRKGATAAMVEMLTSAVDDNQGFAEWLRVVAPLYFHHYDEKVANRLLGGCILSVEGMAAPGETRRYDVTARLNEIRAPTLILVGDDDFILPPDHARRLHEGIPGSRLEIFEACGHLPWAEARDAFFGVLRDWLSTSTATSP